jgi:hypothetical protein
MNQSKWEPLQLSTVPNGLPHLLIKSHFVAPNSYTVELTDFSRIWIESLDRRGIIKKSLNSDHVPIDPSEDASQRRILLEKLEDSLNRKKGTTLSFLGSSEDVLQIEATSELPSPLGTLKWIFDLRLETAETVRRELVFPLVCSAHALKQGCESLLKLLKEKDHVIDKLLDKLEMSGADLAAIFPGISGLKGSGGLTRRTPAARHVKGFEPFQEDEWTQLLEEQTKDSTDISEKLSRVSGLLALCSFQSFSHPPDDWWQHLRWPQVSQVHHPSKTDYHPKTAKEGMIGNQTNDEDLIFQEHQISSREKQTTQKVPSVSTSKHVTVLSQTNTTASDDSTTDEDDLNGPTKPISRSPSIYLQSASFSSSGAPQNSTKPVSKLGQLRSRSATSLEPVSSPNAPRTTSTVPKEDTAEEEDDEAVPGNTTKTPQISGPLGTSHEAHRKTKLGMLTSRNRNVGKPTKPVEEIESSKSNRDTEMASRPRTPTNHQAIEKNKAIVTPPVVKSTRVLSEQEQADEERENLKRQLDAKTRSPHKKKRKF